ncbi:MAG: right-handed parallel beta-helix repeat-containing protein [Candidatus Bipolaricaulota bacterium]|nr:right-handed parallel beta-helix repeat-containing protein [Candidatus Bipolaricaulota bacterium]MDW8031249.1 right-handed parallel beta-helix repeat-containing protein [Candidatus Bipolaricaulota bacterium]
MTLEKLTLAKALEAGGGLDVRGSAKVSLASSTVSGNRYGLVASESSSVNLSNSTVSDNRLNGLKVLGFAAGEVRPSVIAGNGINEKCLEKDYLCTGITVEEKSQVMVTESRIISNADWGMTAALEKCGFDTVIEQNNTTVNQNGMGNPGNHPWPDVPNG